MNMIIREAAEEDLHSVLSLYGQLGMDDGNVLTADEAIVIFRRMKSYPDYTLYVAVSGNDIMGVFSLLIMDNMAHKGAPSGIIEDVVVREDLRRLGIGRRMMNFAMYLCKKKGCYKLALSSNIQRESAHRFYEKLAFRKHGQSFVVDLAAREGDLICL
ncbi:MAG: GNAT family N-acetyltransferase [Nitrospirae bacterium]|nr:GNAT family N-acetyltransferase [Nitrospirota bacterium]